MQADITYSADSISIDMLKTTKISNSIEMDFLNQKSLFYFNWWFLGCCFYFVYAIELVVDRK